MHCKTVFALYLVIVCATAQTCTETEPGFSIGTSDIVAPLDTITFDNLGLSTLWAVSITPLRVTPSSSMDVTMTGTTGGGQVHVRTGLVYLNSDMGTIWNKTDYLLAFDSFFNSATATFEEPIRQFSLLVTHSVSCIPTGNVPRLYLNYTDGSASCYRVNMPPPVNSYNQVNKILKYVGPEANIKHMKFIGCNFAFDNLSFKIDPCDPSPCNAETEICHILADEPTCCSRNLSWDGSACVDICNSGSYPCDTLASCINKRYEYGYICTCPTGYLGNGAPGNCTKLDPTPTTNLDVVPILECIDEDGVAQFGFENNENTTFVIDAPARNNLSPFNIAPVSFFPVGRSTPYPLNAAEVPLNITADTYTWNLEAYTLEFSNIPARACPIQISIIFQFRITGAVNTTEFAEQTRVTFIETSRVAEERVILANFTDITATVKKRATRQLDTALEVELSILPPANATEPSAADVIREFVSDQQQDFEHELQQATPDAQIEVIVSTKESDAALRGVIPPQSIQPVSAPFVAPSAPSAPSAAPVRQPTKVTSDGMRLTTCAASILLSIGLLL